MRPQRRPAGRYPPEKPYRVNGFFASTLPNMRLQAASRINWRGSAVADLGKGAGRADSRGGASATTDGFGFAVTGVSFLLAIARDPSAWALS